MTEQPQLERAYRHFFISRALSAFGDELWAIAVPLYFAWANFSIDQMGIYSSSMAVGSILGFLVLPGVARRLKAASTLLILDSIQISIFVVIAAFMTIEKGASFWPWIALALFHGATDAAWFGASETLIARTIKNDAKDIHRLNFLSTNLGPAIAPLGAASLFAMIGLKAIAALNSLTFLFQILATNKLRQHEPKINVTDHKSNGVRFRDLFNDQIYRQMLILSSIVKISLVGALPFVPFVLGHMNLGTYWLAAGVSCFPLGSLIGAYSDKNKGDSKLGISFIYDSAFMLMATSLIILGIKLSEFGIIGFGCFFAGFFSARYTIGLRTIRQLITPTNLMPDLVSLQGLVTRLITPLSGLILSLLFARATSTITVAFLLIITVSGIWSALKIAQDFERRKQ